MLNEFLVSLNITSSEFPLLLAGIGMVVLCVNWFILAKIKRELKNSFAIFATVVQLAYLIWRVGFTLTGLSFMGIVVGGMLLSMELLGFSQSLTYRMLFMKKPHRKIKRLKHLKYTPKVDIMFTTYNEPERVIRRSIAGAAMLDYPRDRYTIYVCDDGSRESIRQICEEFGAKWITRDEHLHAKAGNLNNCYQNHARGEFSVILDADMVPNSDFLQKTLGYFNESDVAFVQTPQVFFNPDTFQRNLGLERKIPNEQDFFMQEVQIQRQEYNALLFVGSGCVFRNKHLKDIGYIPTGTITEDMATSLLLQEKGYRGVLATDTFAQGLSAESFSDYVTQRVRWCQGNIQVLKKWNPWKMKSLSVPQKQIITDGVLFWFFGLQKMIFTFCPIFFILSGIPIFRADFLMILLLWLPSFLASTLSTKVFHHKNRTWGWAHIYETALAPYLAFAALSELFFKKGKSFKVTPKGEQHDKTTFNYKVAMPHLVLIFLSVLALVVMSAKISLGTEGMLFVYLINGAWIVYNLFALALSVTLCFEKPRVRKHDRLIVDKLIPLEVDGIKTIGRLVNISEGGCNIAPFFREDILHLLEDNDIVKLIRNREIDVDIIKNMPGRDEVPEVPHDPKIVVQVRGCDISGEVLRYIPGKKSYAVKFDEMSSYTYANLVMFIFSNQTTGYGVMQSQSAAMALATTAIDKVEASIGKRKYYKQQKDIELNRQTVRRQRNLDNTQQALDRLLKQA